ncbi:uncharacterized protein N7473_000782 [Penicillium subrubescens]|uniref:uncharacterized protein n=1 Tax=Penicillium subrubescens TaxID=1316194 RepID=UPI0025459FAF|nr:uncharacterized protein N7473_000782 [Penicillium subrubescens]KAJ5911479.1 hypothetical protein N7473_000782 [Penicillium subrubescens]
MSVYDLYFAFGKPGTYTLDHTGGHCSQRMPLRYHEWTAKRPIKAIKNLACDAHDNIFMVWTPDNRSLVCKSHLDPIYHPLQTFLSKEGVVNCRVQFGPSIGEYFVTSERTGRCQWVSPQLDKDMTNETARFKMCSLGIYDSYVAIFTDGSAKWSLGEDYPGLLRILRRVRQGDLVFVALNPYRANEFFVALADGIVHIRASALVEKHVLDILGQYPNLTVVTSDVIKCSRSVSGDQGLPTKYRTKDFMKFIAKNVAGGVISSAVAATFSCTVM